MTCDGPTNAHATRPPERIVCVGALAVFCLAAGTGPFVLLNVTSSEPRGVYLRSLEHPQPGALIAFRPPQQARITGIPPLRLFLKAIAGRPGDLVCRRGNALFINRRPMAAARPRDSLGRFLPQWRECRRLAADEFFVLSTLVPNSFDSRYYGPIKSAAILGVFTPLATWR